MKGALVALLLALAATVGCVTINIYFPAAAAEKAADRIIDEVWQLQPSENRGQGSEQSSPVPSRTP
ncbi:hypothetical protein [Pelomicrobium sp.]|jgi:hypothetical protein|uniref:hypothetical protein n=1 Tax=Pelomicrobium sp. TaxID=2815319 RepID=UPI002FDED44E